ncbi:MAG: trigger factor [Eubacteriales bacterium]|nr:trigger factor [Eubacteriales bacterium]
MNATVENTNPNEVKLTITVGPDKFEEAMEKAYRKVRPQVSIPGFRRGKAPRKVIENYYSEAVFYEDAMDILLPEAYDKAVEENNLFPVDRPQVEIVDVGTGKDFVFTATVTVKPDVTLGEYKGLKAQRPSYPVTDEVVDGDINAARNRVARWVDVERAVETGDRIMLDYSGSVDGEVFEGGTAQNQSLEIGSGRFIPGFEEQLVGVNAGEEKDVTVTFPEEYHALELAGKEAVFHVKVLEIKAKELPELDDEFAKDVSEFDTLDEFRADTRARLEKTNQEQEDNELRDTLVSTAVENATIDLPACMVEQQIDRMMQEFQYQLGFQGIKMEDYVKMTGMDFSQMREQSKEEAEKRVRTSLVLEKIQKEENIEISEDEWKAEVERMAGQRNKPVEEFEASLQDADKEYYRGNMLMKKTVEFLVDNAKVSAAKAKKAAKAAKTAQNEEEEK